MKGQYMKLLTAKNGFILYQVVPRGFISKFGTLCSIFVIQLVESSRLSTSKSGICHNPLWSPKARGTKVFLNQLP